MKKNAFLTRIILLIIVAIMLSAVITTIIYGEVANNVYSQLVSKDLAPRARYFAKLMTKYLNEEISAEILQDMLSDTSVLGAKVHLYDAQGKVLGEIQTTDIFSNSENNNSDDGSQENYVILLGESITSVMKGKEVEESVHSDTTGYDYLVVGIPVYMNNKAVAAVIFTKPIREVNESMFMLNRTLVLSMLFSLLIMLLPSYLAARRMMRPINRMRDIALAMAEGDYSVRADDERSGELGQLASAFNYLATRLSETISWLEIERNRLRRTLDGLNEGIVAVDAKGIITHTNPAILRMFGHDANTVLDERLQIIDDESVWDDFDQAIENKCAMQRSVNRDNMVLRIAITPLEDEEGRIVGAVGLFRDITESERLERMQRDYVANVSHELRTPVTGVRGLAEALHDGVVKSEQDKQRYYGYILRETLRLSRLIDDLLELSRLQSGTIAVDKREVSICSLIKELGDRYKIMTDEVGLKFSIDLDIENCPKVFSNSDRVEQVLVILLDNAIKYTDEAGKITIGATWNNENVFVFVKDEGVGISKQDLPYLFNRFYKSDKSHTGGGTGLGLSIARELLSMMGETIWVESEVAKGSTFTFTLKRFES